MQDNKASRIVLLVAVVLGILSMVLLLVYTNQQDASRDVPIKVVVAARDLAMGRAIDPARDFKIDELPAKYRKLAERGVNPETISAMKGQKLNRRILEGTPIMLADFSASAELEPHPGYGGFSLPVRGANAVSGLLIPGDFVKILVTKPAMRYATVPTTGNTTPKPSSTLQWETTEVINVPVKVLAVGSRLIRSRQQFAAADPNEGGESDSQQTVMVEVTEEQARTILQETGAYQLPITLFLYAPAAKTEEASAATAPAAKSPN